VTIRALVSQTRIAVFVVAIMVLTSLVTWPNPGWTQPPPFKISIGTGPRDGVNKAAGVALCKFINQKKTRHGFQCRAQNTVGSTASIKNIRAGLLTFGIVQSDIQFYALKGYGPFRDLGPDPKLRAVLSLHPEPFTVVVRQGSDILKFDDLVGKRIDIGTPGSGQRTTMKVIMRAKGWTRDSFAKVSGLPSAQQSAALCNNQIDAVVRTVGHPNSALKETTNACDVRLLNVSGPEIDRLIKKYPYYSTMTIPAGTYKDTPSKVRTFGVTATLVTSSDTPDKVVEEMVQSLFNQFSNFKFSHPAFFTLMPAEMGKKGLTAPLHASARLYFDRAENLSKLLDVKDIPL